MSPSPRDLRHLDALLAAALELEPQDREAWVTLHAGVDSDLADELRALLREAEDDSLLLEPAGALDPDFLLQLPHPGSNGEPEPSPALTSHPMIGARCGSYRLIEELGSGGMGVVFLAERADGEFERQVAVKLLRGLGGPSHPRKGSAHDLEGRLRRERQILAHLDHPNIARLLDGGVSDNGQPYLVMELVRGTRIDRYCEQNHLTIRQRLRLFLDVIRAVESAHRALVVHRDIKPSNILVGKDGKPKLLDFGIAALIDPENGGDGLTRTDLRPMTPEYASPEQIRGLPATTSSDVFQLGLNLYRLLTGEPAHQVGSGSAAELERRVCETITRRPSRAASEAGRDEAARALRGDLDNILLKALAKEPEQRYSSAESLRADLERYLGNRPVAARRPTLGYRCGRFVRRHRIGVSAAALLLAASLAAAAFHTSRVTAERNRARLEAEKANTVKEFLVELFTSSNPYIATETDLTLRAVLDRGAERIRDELADQPLVRSELSIPIGQAYEVLGLYEQARPLLEGAVAAVESAEVESAEEGTQAQLAEALWALAGLRSAEGRHAEAEALLRQVLRIDEASQDLEPGLAAATLSNLGNAVHDQGRYGEARALFERSASLFEQVEDVEPAEMAVCLTTLAWFAWIGDQDLPAAEAYFRRALALTEQAFGTDHPRYAAALDQLASCLQEQGKMRESEALSRQSLAITLRHAPPDSAHVDTALASWGDLQRELRDFEGSENSYREALRVAERREGPSTEKAVYYLNGLTNTLIKKGDIGNAAPLAERTLRLSRELHGKNSMITASAHGQLAIVRVHQDRLVEAQAEIDAAVKLVRSHLGGHHPRNVRFVRIAVFVDQARGHTEVAEGRLRNLLQEVRLGDDASSLRNEVGIRFDLGVLLAEDRPEEALAELDRARRLWVEIFGEEDARVATTDVYRGEILAAQGHFEQAAATLRSSLANLDQFEPEFKERAERALRQLPGSGV